MVNQFEKGYFDLLKHVIVNGKRKMSRAGETLSVFGHSFEIHDLRYDRFPILTSRKMYYKPIFGELAAFLQGATYLQEFKDHGCNYWDANAEAWNRNRGLNKDKMRVGRIYGAQWRDWDGTEDQLAGLVRNLQTDPNSRRHVVSAWNPSDVGDMCLFPCHVLFQCYVLDDYLDMIVYMRSVDICLGLPTDMVLYAALLILLAHETKKKPGTLMFMLGDTHLYLNHMDGVKKLISRSIKDLPTYELASDASIDTFAPGFLELKDYVYDDPIPYQLNV